MAAMADMRFVEVVARRATAMARGAEFYRMLRITDFRLQHVVLSSQLGDVNQITLLRRLPRTFIDCHCLILLVQMLKADRAANLFNQLRRNCIDCMMCSIMLHLRPVLVLVITHHGVPNLFRFGLITAFQQRTRIFREVNARAAVQRLGGLGKCFTVQE